VGDVEKLAALRAAIDYIKDGESLLAAVDALKPRLVRAHPSNSRRSSLDSQPDAIGIPSAAIVELSCLSVRYRIGS
jgi:hypothetical protein